VAHATAEVYLLSSVKNGKADLGLWLAKNLDRAKARLGYRVIDKGAVVNRGSVEGEKLDWRERSGDIIGQLLLEVPPGAVVQCIASYAGHAHHIRWFADPTVHQNARAAVLSSIDQTGKLFQRAASNLKCNTVSYKVLRCTKELSTSNYNLKSA
jgi:hypothetical protein